ncbi:methyltransferase [Saccharibacillus sp. O16]|nr:methyltransferase [Saccharibacillus sp. O16]
MNVSNKPLEPQERSHTWAKVDRYLERKLIPTDLTLTQALERNEAAGLPAYDVSPLQGKLLQLLVRMNGAQRVLEIGTLGGYSTIWMARALPQGGQLVTLELEPLHAEVARHNLRGAGIDDSLVDIRVGDAREQLEALIAAGVQPFDFIFIDADKPNNPAYLEAALKLSKPGSVIVGDNIVRGGEVIDEASEDARVQGVRQFFDLLENEPRIEATALQTVGGKGYDGFVVGIVR